MAKILCIEPEHSQIRVAVVEKKGRICRVSKCFRFLAPQGAVEDGYIRDTSNLGKKLKEELASRKIKIKKVCFLASSTRIATREVSIPMVKEKTIQSLIEDNAAEMLLDGRLGKGDSVCAALSGEKIILTKGET